MTEPSKVDRNISKERASESLLKVRPSKKLRESWRFSHDGDPVMRIMENYAIRSAMEHYQQPSGSGGSYSENTCQGFVY